MSPSNSPLDGTKYGVDYDYPTTASLPTTDQGRCSDAKQAMQTHRSQPGKSDCSRAFMRHHCGVPPPPAYSAFGPFRITEPKQQTSKCLFTRKGKARLAKYISGCLDSHPCGGIRTRSTVGLSLRQVNTYPMLDRNQQFPCNYHNPLSIPTDRTKAHGPSSQQGLCSLHHVCVWTVE